MNTARETIKGMCRRAAEAKLRGASSEEAYKEVGSIANSEAEYLLRTAQVPTVFWGALTYLYLLTQMRKMDKEGMHQIIASTASAGTLLYLFVQMNTEVLMQKAHLDGLDETKTKALIIAHDPFASKNESQCFEERMFN